MKDSRLSWLLLLSLISILLFPAVAFAQEPVLEIYLSDPSEGETYYAGPTSLCYTIKIQGYIISPIDPFKDIQVTLELLQDGEVVETRTTTPNLYGEFLFSATVNPGAPDGMFTPVEIEAHCEDCHYRTGLDLPKGNFTVRVTARSPGGEIATAERSVKTDLSQYVTIPVQVILQGSPQEAVTNIPVLGSTWLYLWRSRVKSGLTGEDGTAKLKVEALSLAPTEYQVEVGPAILNGYLYEGTAPVRVMLDPGESTGPEVTIAVSRKLGQIQGQFTDEGTPISITTPIWLVHLPDGSVQKTQVKDGAFTVTDVPIEQYLITANARLLADTGFSMENQLVDLSKAVETTVNLPLQKIEPGSVSARILDVQGRFLPFTWISFEKEGLIRQLAPGAEALEVFGLPETDEPAVVSAPGFYSQAVVLDAGKKDAAEIKLTIRPETRLLSWGDGQILLPPESVFEEHGLDIQFEQGWLWGEGGGEQPLKIYLPGAVVNIQRGKFALENVPGSTPWFYLWSGRANIETVATGAITLISANQMVNIISKGKLNPVTFDPVVTRAIHSGGKRPFDPAWQPGLRAQIRDRLALIGIGSAQVITLITYLLVFLSIILFPVYWIYSTYRKRRRSKPNFSGIEEIK